MCFYASFFILFSAPFNSFTTSGPIAFATCFSILFNGVLSICLCTAYGISTPCATSPYEPLAFAMILPRSAAACGFFFKSSIVSMME